jgi:hypothetical protein
MLPKNPSSGRKRPTARYKPPMAVAIARTRRAKRLGLIAQDAVPSHTPAGRKRYDAAWKAKNPHYQPLYNAKRRQRCADARALKTAPVNSREFIAAALRHVDCPKDESEKWQFVFLKMLERGIPPVEPSPLVKSFGDDFSVVPSRPRRRRIADQATPQQEWVFIAE